MRRGGQQADALLKGLLSPPRAAKAVDALERLPLVSLTCSVQQVVKDDGGGAVKGNSRNVARVTRDADCTLAVTLNYSAVHPRRNTAANNSTKRQNKGGPLAFTMLLCTHLPCLNNNMIKTFPMIGSGSAMSILSQTQRSWLVACAWSTRWRIAGSKTRHCCRDEAEIRAVLCSSTSSW